MWNIKWLVTIISVSALIPSALTSAQSATIETNEAANISAPKETNPQRLEEQSIKTSESVRITPYRAIYTLDYDGVPFTAEGVRELKVLDNGEYFLSNNATSMVANIIEETTFAWPQGPRLQPKQYEYHLKQPFGNRDAVVTFDWNNAIVTNDVQSKPWQMTVPQGTLDKLSYQLQLRYDLKAGLTDVTYPIADGGKLKTYRFKVLGEELLNTPLGPFTTVKVERIRAASSRNTLFWLAKDFDYLLIKLRQTKKKGNGFELLLKSATLAGHPLESSTTAQLQ